MIKAILFDIDGTLIDFMTMKHKSCEAAIDAMIAAGLNMKREDALKKLYELYDKYGIEYQQIFQKFLEIDKKIDYKILVHGVIAYRKIREFYLMPYPGVIPTLIQLKKKYTLAVITDAPRLQAWLRMVSMKLEDFFDLVITAADVRKQKTSTAPYRAALNALKIKPEEALMIGDRVERDIKTAKSLGIKTCLARYGDIKKTEKGLSGADFEIEDIRDLLKLGL